MPHLVASIRPCSQPLRPVPGASDRGVQASGVPASIDSGTLYCHDMPMPNEQEYTIGELATLAGVTPRTIRYYVSIGLLPSPGQSGPGTRYGEGHLARLRLIRRLQREHLPLGEIAVRLEGLDDVAVEAALAIEDLGPAQGEESAIGGRRRCRPLASLGARSGPRVGPRLHQPIEGGAGQATDAGPRAGCSAPAPRIDQGDCLSRPRPSRWARTSPRHRRAPSARSGSA